jgi:hypothetical protein
MTGEQLESNIYIGPTYYMRLKHMVKDKINYRARGPNTGLTRQPVQGRANDGGLRIGEMERDGVLAHGLSYFLNESFLVRGDEYYMAVCNKTGAIAIYNEAKNIFLSPFADGPINFHTNPDGTMNIKNVSRFGRSFSLVKIPYSFKLLIHELQAMNIQMRIITDENVDQLTSMSYSDNINKLLKTDEKDIKKIITMYTNDISKKIDNINKFNIPQENPVLPTQDSTRENENENDNEFAPDSPDYNQPNSPPYNPDSPDYNKPRSPDYSPDSPDYQPNSPPYNPDSPPYNPDSPPYNPQDSPIIVQGEELPTGSQVLPTGEIVLPPKQSLNIPFIPASLDNQNTLVNSDMKPESKEVTFAEPQSSILNVAEAKEDKPSDSNENKDSSSSNSDTRKIINI